MSLAIAHFALGAGATALLLALLAPEVEYQRTLTVCGGLWALVPDLGYVSPVFRDAFALIKTTPFGNLFWFHTFLDAQAPGRGSRTEAAVMVVFLLLATIIVEHRAARSED